MIIQWDFDTTTTLLSAVKAIAAFAALTATVVSLLFPLFQFPLPWMKPNHHNKHKRLAGGGRYNAFK